MAARIRWNIPAFEQIRRDPTLAEELFEHAKAIEQRAGSDKGYLAVRGHGRTRDRAAVLTSNLESMKDNADNNTLLRSLGSGGSS